MLTDKDIDHIASLARIELDGRQRDHFRTELQSILEYIAVLERVPTADVEPLYQVTGQMNQVRPDEHRNDFPVTEELTKALVGQAPGHENGFVKVKSVVEQRSS